MHLNINIKYFSLVVATLFGFALSVALSWVFYQKDSETIELNFKKDVDGKAAALEREIVLKLETLYSLKGLFDSSDNIEPDEFNQFTNSILARQKNIQALVWMPKIKQSEREEYVLTRRQTYPDFELTEEASIGKMISAKERDVYFPVYYIEPVSANEVAIGFDFASNQERFKTLKLSRDSGMPQATGNIKLLQDSSKQGFLIFMPVYDGQSNTLEKRREQLSGFVLGVYRAGDLFTSAIQGINFSLIDITNSTNDILYVSSVEEIKKQLQSTFEYKKELPEISGRKWAIIATPTNGYIAERRTILPYATIIVGILVVILFTIYTFIIIRNLELIEKTVLERTKDLYDAKKKLETLSRTDSLTNIGNRRDFDETMEKEWNRGLRDKTPLSMMMIDIDYFKLFNDKYGHAAGDACLKNIAYAMNKTLKRASDKVTRYGGEEFVIILPNTKDVFSYAEDCRQNIENLRIPHEGSITSKYVTISIGVATAIPDLNSELVEFISTADRALYEAKESGRNKVVSAQATKSKNTNVVPI